MTEISPPGDDSNDRTPIGNRLPFYRSLPVRQTAFVGLVVILTAGALGLAGDHFARMTLRNQIHDRLQVVTADRQRMVAAYAAQQRERVALVASRTRLRKLVQEHLAQPGASENFLAESSGILNDAKRSTHGFEDIWITDPDGVAITVTNEKYLGRDFSQEAEFQEGLKQTHMGVLREIDGEWRTYLSAPARTNEGMMLGVVMVLFNAAPLAGLISDDTGLGLTGEVLIATRDGEQIRYLLPPQGNPRMTVAAESVPAMDAALRGETGYGTTTYAGQHVLAAYRPVAYQREQVRRWGMVAKMDVEEAYAPVARLQHIMLALLGGLLVGGLSASYFLVRRSTQPILSLAAATRRVSTEQDYSVRVALAESADEAGQLAAAFNQLLASLRGVLAETKTMTEEVATSSNEITIGAQQQVAALTESASSLNQITTTAVQFKSTVQEFVDRGRAVREAAEDMGRRSDEGRELTQESVTRIDQVRENAHAAGESVLDLSEQMQRINEVTSSVNEIAEQTKLLSLNASIEAARAGEEGRGFAVVATQVRELANQSKEAAGRIEFIVGEAQKSMRTVVTKIEEGSRLSEESREIVTRTKESFDQIAAAVYQTIEAMREIAAGAKEQEQGVTQLADGIAQVETASTEALATTHQTQKSIEAIDERIRTLNDRMGKFKT
jgi:methyl-accepting chemotaxis protein